MIEMWRALAFSLAVAGCTASTGGATGDAGKPADSSTPDSSKTYHGTLEMSPTVPFGGVVYCAYSITLRQIDVSITMRPSGEVTGAAVQALNVEATVGSCPYMPSPPSIANYSLGTAKMIPNGSMLTLTGDPANSPVVALAITTTASGTKQSAMLSFQRTDQSGELAWNVVVTVPLTAP